jgi:hypothetical protein
MLIWSVELGVLNLIKTIDELAVSLHMPKTKQQSKLWAKKGQTDPVKAKVQVSRTTRLGPGLLSLAGCNLH